PNSIRGSLLACYRGNAGQNLGLLSDLVKEVDSRKVRDIFRALKLSPSTGSLGVDDALGNAFSREVREGFDQLGVFEKGQSTSTRLGTPEDSGSRRVLDGASLGECVNWCVVL